jgi:site-specific DNA-methyltransferase (adenine-specific)
MYKIINGDSLEVLKRATSNSIDAIVTDPPYGLSFMGKKWDYEVPSVEIWKECLRVLKPGGYLLSFAGTRTQHRMAVNIEDAGFEIRDMIAWVYGSGFPKSLNIGKAVDKLQGNEREVNGLVDSKTSDNKDNNTFNASPRYYESTKGTSEWEGWGTALKPALEPITVARKPLEEKTVAQNVLKWGTGGINIDGSRVESSGKDLEKLNGEWDREWNTDYSTYADKVGGSAGFNMDSAKVENKGITGRFPANLIHDGSEEVVRLFPESMGMSGGGKHKATYNKDGVIAGGGHDGNDSHIRGDSGSAARFFYCAKASKSDRNEGLDDFEEVKTNKMGSFGSQENFDCRDGANRVGDKGSSTQRNHHPTVKPTKLMQYLVKLVTPKGGKVLDPFMGSGSTGKACMLEGFDFIGIDLDPEYCKIAEARIKAVEKSIDL